MPFSDRDLQVWPTKQLIIPLIISNFYCFSSDRVIWSFTTGKEATDIQEEENSHERPHKLNYAQAEGCLLQHSQSSSLEHPLVQSKQMPHKQPFLKKENNRKNNCSFPYEAKTFNNLEVTF